MVIIRHSVEEFNCTLVLAEKKLENLWTAVRYFEEITQSLTWINNEWTQEWKPQDVEDRARG